MYLHTFMYILSRLVLNRSCKESSLETSYQQNSILASYMHLMGYEADYQKKCNIPELFSPKWW